MDGQRHRPSRTTDGGRRRAGPAYVPARERKRTSPHVIANVSATSTSARTAASDRSNDAPYWR